MSNYRVVATSDVETKHEPALGHFFGTPERKKDLGFRAKSLIPNVCSLVGGTGIEPVTPAV